MTVSVWVQSTGGSVRSNQMNSQVATARGDELDHDKGTRMGGENSRKGVGKGTGQSDSWIGERGRRGEPIAGGDEQADGVGNSFRPPFDASEDGGEKAKCCNELPGPLTGARPHLG